MLNWIKQWNEIIIKQRKERYLWCLLICRHVKVTMASVLSLNTSHACSTFLIKCGWRISCIVSKLIGCYFSPKNQPIQRIQSWVTSWFVVMESASHRRWHHQYSHLPLVRIATDSLNLWLVIPTILYSRLMD